MDFHHTISLRSRLLGTNASALAHVPNNGTYDIFVEVYRKVQVVEVQEQKTGKRTGKGFETAKELSEAQLGKGIGNIGKGVLSGDGEFPCASLMRRTVRIGDGKWENGAVRGG